MSASPGFDRKHAARGKFGSGPTRKMEQIQTRQIQILSKVPIPTHLGQLWFPTSPKFTFFLISCPNESNASTATIALPGGYPGQKETGFEDNLTLPLSLGAHAPKLGSCLTC
ncbi:MAG: hypothetical protein JJU15_09110 [Pararhodobacter sp.]|nr:hypothetical protein [Pararhodobacter sp.]